MGDTGASILGILINLVSLIRYSKRDLYVVS